MPTCGVDFSMMRTALETALREILGNRPEVRLVLLFGSRSQGRATEESDVDLAVEGDHPDTFRLARELSLSLGKEVDVVDLARAGYPLVKTVLRDGEVVYQNRPGTAAQWRSRTIAQLETDRPWFERMRNAYLKRLAEELGG